jgi:hypothetical protein
VTATSRPPPMRGPEFRTLQRELAAAQDHQIARVLQIVDGLESRTEADHLISALRKRLAELRPMRKLNFDRLLFAPLDPLIVNAPDWTPAAEACVPRLAKMR